MRYARWLALAVILGTMGLVAGQSTTKSAKPRDTKGESISQQRVSFQRRSLTNSTNAADSAECRASIAKSVAVGWLDEKR